MASQRLGMEIEHVAPGAATLTMTVTEDMTNGHKMGHGGYIFTLADSAFAFACNTYNQRTVAQHCSITYIAPVSEGDRLTATARETAQFGRNGIYDVRVDNQRGEHVAEFREQMAGAQAWRLCRKRSGDRSPHQRQHRARQFH